MHAKYIDEHQWQLWIHGEKLNQINFFKNNKLKSQQPEYMEQIALSLSQVLQMFWLQSVGKWGLYHAFCVA